MKMINIWIDGSSTGRKGAGGVAAIIVYPTELHVKAIPIPHSMQVGNNQMECYALVIALQMVVKKSTVTIHTDSRNVIGWMTQGWERKDPRINAYCITAFKLWKDKKLKITFKYVRGHSGIAYNEQCDKLAKYAKENQIE